MNRARRLLPAENGHDEWNNRSDGGRHSQSGPQHHRKQEKDYSEVAQTLKDVVAAGLLSASLTKMEMIGNNAPDGFPRPIVSPGQQIILEMALQETATNVNNSRENGNPCREKMNVPARSAHGDFQNEWKRQVDEGRRVDVSHFAPIETWVREQNRDSAAQ